MKTRSAKLPAQQSRAVAAQLKRSKIYRDYERAFRETTGLPLSLRPIESFDLANHGDPKKNPFCALMGQSNRSCAAYLQLQQEIEAAAEFGPRTLTCFAGLSHSAVPVRVGENLVAFLTTGQILRHQPSKMKFSRTRRELIQWGVAVDFEQLEEAYFRTRVLTRKRYESILRLLTIFALHLAELSNQLMVMDATAESPMVSKARLFIALHHTDKLSLTQVAQAVHRSRFSLCKLFKRSTGVGLTEYLARVRMEKAKILLVNPHKRVSEAAYEAGFQSLSQFNRVFYRLAGESPSAYREQLHNSGHRTLRNSDDSVASRVLAFQAGLQGRAPRQKSAAHSVAAINCDDSRAEWLLQPSRANTLGQRPIATHAQAV